MLLTLKQSAHHGFKSFHDYSPPTPPSSSRFSPALTNAGPSVPSLPPATQSTTKPMSTPHRGLPPPAAMTLPQPTQAPPGLGQSSYNQPPGQLPAPPQQWQGSEEPMRNWLNAKAEEDKRKQEEEKTRQEALRLEQRKVEQDMLRASLAGHIPPHMIPIIFAGMGGGNPGLLNTSLEWAQHFMAQAQQVQQQAAMQQQQQQQQAIGTHPHSSPELRRETRQLSHPYGQPQHPTPAPIPSTPIGPGSQQSAGFLPGYPMSPGRSRGQLPGPGTLSRLPPASELPRLNTGEIHTHQPPQGPPGQSSHPLHQSQSANPSHQESQSSPIYFHHWQPPTSQANTSGANQPSTPSDVPASSPRKRKAQGPQQAAPPPSSQSQRASPPFSQGGSSVSGTPSGRRRGHSRQRSDLSSRGMEGYGRTSSRHRHSESVVSTRSGISPTQQQGFESATPGGTPGARGAAHRMSASERSDTRQGQEHEGPETKQEDRDSADRELSSRISSKRDDTRD